MGGISSRISQAVYLFGKKAPNDAGAQVCQGDLVTSDDWATKPMVHAQRDHIHVLTDLVDHCAASYPTETL
jgi:hypothetical protein